MRAELVNVGLLAMVKIHRLSFEELFPLLDLSGDAIVLFDAAFSSYQLDVNCSDNLETSAPSFHDIYHITCESGDECEDYIVNHMEVTSLPCFIYYRAGQKRYVDYDMQFDVSRSKRIFSQFVPPSSVSLSSYIPPRSTSPSANVVHNFGMLFIGGDKSAVGKSTTCLALLASLLTGGKGSQETQTATQGSNACIYTDVMNFRPEDLAYIKPVTQCEADTTVTRFCNEVGIACVPIGPVVFYKGFTRSFLVGESEYSREEYLQQVCDRVAALCLGKKLVLIDGVGYPSVGSICGLSNAEICCALGQGSSAQSQSQSGLINKGSPPYSPPVLLVGKPGVGDAVDSYNLNERYFQSFGVRVLGALFNKLNADRSNYYYVDNCRESIELYFRRKNQDRLARNNAAVISGKQTDYLFDNSEAKVYGFIPMFPAVSEMTEVTAEGMEMKALVAHFMKHADVRLLLRDLWLYQRDGNRAGTGAVGTFMNDGPRLRYLVRRGQFSSKDVDTLNHSHASDAAHTSMDVCEETVAITSTAASAATASATGASCAAYRAPGSTTSLARQQQQQTRKRKSREEISMAVEQKFGRIVGG